MAEGSVTCHRKWAMVTCAELTAHWDQVIGRFLVGGPAVPPDRRMRAWAEAYRGRGHGEVNLNLTFLRTWTGHPSLTANAMVTFELYPWHSTAVTAPMRPDPGIVREFVWQPIRELDAPVFAFGKPWFGLLEDGFGLQVVDRLGAGGRPYPTEVPSRAVLVLRDEDGPVVIAERHVGSAGPPRRSETRVLREAIEPWLGEP